MLVINNIGGDDLIDSGDHGQPLDVEGSTVNALDGSVVDIEIAGKHYQAIVHNNAWTLTVPGADVAALADQNLLLLGTLTTTGGATANAQHHLVVAADPLALKATGHLQEDLAITADGQVFPGGQIGSVDHPGTLTGNYGTLTIQADGTYHYALNNAGKFIQGLSTGQTLPESFMFPITEASGQKHSAVVVLDIAGLDDNPIIGGTLTVERSHVHQNTTHMSTLGHFQVSDRDSGDHLSISINDIPLTTGETKIDTLVGRLSVSPDGTWSYAMDKSTPERTAFEHAAAAGTPQHETFTLKVTDSHGNVTTETLVITMVGDGTDYTLRGEMRGAVTEDIATETHGQLHVVDRLGVRPGSVVNHVLQPDVIYDWHVDPQNNGMHGAFTVDQDGLWHYSLNKADQVIQQLSHGDMVPDHATIVAVDPTTGKTITRLVSVDIMGSNDVPTVTGQFTASISEDATQAASGHLTGTDPDSSETVSFDVISAQSGKFGTFSIDANGDWHYDIDNSRAATQALSGGQVATETFSVVAKSTDGTVINKQISVNVSGHEDAPVIIGAHGGDVTEDGNAAASGQLMATDADTGDKPVFTPQANVAGTYGTFSVDEHGAWAYHLDDTLSATDGLATGQTEHETFSVTVHTADGETATQDVVVNVHGHDDPPPPPPPLAFDEPDPAYEDGTNPDISPYLAAVGAGDAPAAPPQVSEATAYLDAVGADAPAVALVHCII